MAGFQAALAAGVNSIECDLVATYDGIIVVHHDYLREGVPVRTLSLAEVKSFDVGKANPAFPSQKVIKGAQIPTLEELLNLCRSYPKCKLNLEIKRDALHPEWTLEPRELASKIVTQVRESGLSAHVYYSSFDPEVIVRSA